MLSTRDGNNHILTIAWVICLSENADNWRWFGSRWVRFGARKYLNLAGSVIIHDRQKGIPYFIRFFSAYDLWCFLHIIKNLYRHIRGKKRAKYNLLWALQKAPTEQDYFEVLKKIHATSQEAAEWLNNTLDHGKVFKYEMYKHKVRTSGHRCSNVQEIKNGVLKTKGLRAENPGMFNKRLVDEIGKNFQAWRKEAEKWNPEH